MPGADRRGPRGEGPRTGRGLGRCRPRAETESKDLSTNDKVPSDRAVPMEGGLGLGRRRRNRVRGGAGGGRGRGGGVGRGRGFGRGFGRGRDRAD